MTADEIVLQVREYIQIFDLEPLRDGFTDDVIVRGSTRILPYVNRAYRDLVRKGIYQCWHELVMTSGKANYRLPGTFTLVHQMYMLDPTDSKTYDLDYTDIPRQSDPTAYFRATRSVRPTSVGFSGNMVFFNFLPDKAYKAYFLADTVPAPLALRADAPTALDAQFHDAIVAGASFYLGRMALNRPNAGQGAFVRFTKIDEEWTNWQKDVLEVQTSRFVPDSRLPLMSDNYRGFNPRRG